jgi:hypothetical protein
MDIAQELKEGFSSIITMCNVFGEDENMDKELREVEMKVLNNEFETEDLINELEWQTKTT